MGSFMLMKASMGMKIYPEGVFVLPRIKGAAKIGSVHYQIIIL
jgi:hypothetical protein